MNLKSFLAGTVAGVLLTVAVLQYSGQLKNETVAPQSDGDGIDTQSTESPGEQTNRSLAEPIEPLSEPVEVSVTSGNGVEPGKQQIVVLSTEGHQDLLDQLYVVRVFRTSGGLI